VPPKRRFFQGPPGVTTQKTPFFIVTAVKTSNLTQNILCGLVKYMCLVEYFSQKYLGFGLYPFSGLLKSRKHSVSETESVSVLR
jgi:hypothetical protein